MRSIYVSIIWCALLLGLTPSLHAQNPNWVPPNAGEFVNTANVISTIALNGIISNHEEDRIAFFVDDVLRGVSTPIALGNSEYLHFATVYSNLGSEVMDIRVYHHETDIVYEVAKKLLYTSNGIYGTADLPIVTNIYDEDDAPISLINVPDQFTLEGIPFQSIDMLEYLIVEGDQSVAWSFTPNPSLVVSFDENTLNVSGVVGFSGTTLLTVRATKIDSNEKPEGAKKASSLTDETYAETTISFQINPEYAGPAWINIPAQSIVLGSQFETTDLHDFEYQYGGPAIQYDYLPVIIANKPPLPKPNWALTKKLEVNMSVTLRINYTPKYSFHHPDDLLVARINGEIRGVSSRDALSNLHFLTIGGSAGEDDLIDLTFYSGQKKAIFQINTLFNFQPYNIIGSIDQPLVIDLTPLLPKPPTTPIPGGFAAVPVVILDPTYVGIEHFRYIAFDPLYPEELRADTTTSYCIAASLNDLNTLYADFDGDGLGNPDISILACNGVLNYVTNSDDCDDTNFIACASDTIIINDPGLCEANNVLLLNPSFIDCNVTAITNDALVTFPVGITAVTWTLEFNETTTKSCKQIVTVIDVEAPIPDIGGTDLGWNEVSNLFSDDAIKTQEFGFSVDMSYEWAVVGARNDGTLGSGAGAAYLLKYDGQTWTQHSKIMASDAEPDDFFGHSVSISENRVLIGALGEDTGGVDAGAAYIFEYDGTNWIETAILKASNMGQQDYFGISVSLSQDYAIIGANEEDTGANNSGAAYIFELKSSWIEVAILKASDLQGEDQFGSSVSISGKNAVVSAPFEDSEGVNSGAAYVFHKDENLGNWTEFQKLTASNPAPNDEFGSSVDMSGNHLIVGAPNSDSSGNDSGLATVFRKFGPLWVEDQVLQSSDISAGDKFGSSVSISANYITVGSPEKSNILSQAGAAYIFRNASQLWIEQSILLASDAEATDQFGSAVAIHGHNVICGAPYKDSTLPDVGKVYLYHLNAGLPVNYSPCPSSFDTPTATDNCDGLITGEISFSSPYMGLDQYEVTWTYTDSSGNSSIQYQMIQTLGDTIPPTIQCPSELVLLLDDDGNIDVFLGDDILLPSDACGPINISYMPSSFSCADIGPNIVTIIAYDANQNETICEVPVTIDEGPKLVINLNDDGPGSLRKLIEGSCGGTQSIIFFDTLLNGTIDLTTGQILINKDLEIIGLGKDVININANNNFRIFEVTAGSEVILKGLQFSNGEELIDGGAILNNGILNMDNLRFVGNRQNGIPYALTNQGQIIIQNGIVEIKE